MKRPKFIPENYRETNRFIRDYKPKEKVQSAGFAFMRFTHSSDLYDYYPGALDRTGEYIDEGNSIALIMGHVSNADTLTFAGLTKARQLRRLQGKTKIPAKSSLQSIPFFGRFFDDMNAHPTNRYKDFTDEQIKAGLNEEVAEALLAEKADWLDEGLYTAEMPPGKRKPEEPQTVGEFKKGLVRTMQKLKDDTRVAVQPLGVAYERKILGIPFKPVTVVGELIPASELNKMSTEEATDFCYDRVQELTTVAFTIAALKRQKNSRHVAWNIRADNEKLAKG